MATPDEILALKASITSLNVAIASGARSVTLRGQTITYNTTASLIQARDDQQRQLLIAESGDRRSRQSYGYQSGRGYD